MRTAGLVDLRVNGFAGVGFNAGGALDGAAMDHALAAMRATGVTTCLPTIITAEAAVMLQRLQALDAAISASRLGPSMCPGYHVEGPFLNPADGYAGCHPSSALTAPDYRLIERLEAAVGRPVLLTTVAPELPSALAFIVRARSAGKLVAIGYSAVGPASAACPDPDRRRDGMRTTTTLPRRGILAGFGAAMVAQPGRAASDRRQPVELPLRPDRMIAAFRRWDQLVGANK